MQDFPAPLHGLLYDIISGIPEGTPCGRLNSVVLEPLFLARVSEAQHNTEDREIVWLMARGCGRNPQFALRSVHDIEFFV